MEGFTLLIFRRALAKYLSGHGEENSLTMSDGGRKKATATVRVQDNIRDALLNETNVNLVFGL